MVIKMDNLKNNKGVVLILCYFVLVVLLVLSAAVFVRSINESNNSERNTESLQAFYQAEAGIAYAYAEILAAGNYDWYTHEDRSTPVTGSTPTMVQDSQGKEVYFTYPVPKTMPNTSFDGAGHYQEDNSSFRVKTYPERDGNSDFTNIVVILSQATVKGVTRTIEYRFAAISVYEYFFFFPDTAFIDMNYDGRNFGGIHVNGDIIFRPSAQLNFLTRLTCSSNNTNEGYMQTRQLGQFVDLHGTRTGPGSLPSAMYTNINSRFESFAIPVVTGDYTAPNAAITLHHYLETDNASWDFDKYAGSTTSPAATYQINDSDLKARGIYELQSGYGSVPLNDPTLTIDVGAPYSSNTEQQLFQQLYNDGAAVPQATWDAYWVQWKQNHANDTSFSDGRNWERRYFRAGYNWTNPDVPSGVNMEWWQDLEYGTDRASSGGDMFPARLVDNITGGAHDPARYFLNTKHQSAEWGNWLSTNNLDQFGTNQTLIQDKSQGAQPLQIGSIMDISQYAANNRLKQKAQNGGIYIGDDGLGNFLNPISSHTNETQFYNSAAPALNGTLFAPNSVLKIDVNSLKQQIENDIASGGPLADFNGVLYVDLTGNSWTLTHYDDDASGVMLFNAERLPDGGLSLVTPQNVYIKGNYNLDPTGLSAKNRTADDINVINRVIADKSYIVDENDLEWQPAEIVTRRQTYFNSQDFPELSYMTMADQYRFQYYDEQGPLLGAQNFVSDPNYPENINGNTWVPAPAVTYSAKTKIKQWFDYYRDASGNPVPIPSAWTAGWVAANWNGSYNLDTDGDTIPDTYITAAQLQGDVKNHIRSAYDNTFSYTAIHGPSGTDNPDTPSKYYTATQDHIYNSAVISPYWKGASGGEGWTANKIFNCSFIDLPQTATYQASIAAGPQYLRNYGIWGGTSVSYESRFGRGANFSDIPNANLMFGADSSWRQISAENFN
jgi:hypothetical protein